MLARKSALPALLALAAFATSARAAPFDDATGKLALDGAGWAWDMDAFGTRPEGLDVYVTDKDWGDVSTGTVEGRFAHDAAGAIEGTGYMEFGGNLANLFVPTYGLTGLEGRRAEISLWYRARGTRAEGTLYWYSGDVRSALASGDTRSLYLMGILPLLPTGRATDDGWVELSSGPFDWELGGVLAPGFLTISDPHGPASYYESGTVAYDPSARVDLDGFEIRDLGPAEVPVAACTVPTEDTTCGDLGLCLFGRCAEAAPVVGPAFATKALRADYLDRRAAEFSLFDGSRMAGTLMPGLEAARAALAEEALPKRFWPVLDHAVQQLRDGHASAPIAGYTEPISGGACVNLGEADLLPGGGEAPMVFQVSASNPAGEGLARGDVLTAVDGLDWKAWRTLAARWFSYPGDPAGLDVMTAAQVLDAAVRAGATVTFTRCAEAAPDGSGCAVDLETVEVDYATVAGEPMWAGTPPAWASEALGCDYRFERMAPVSGDPTDYLLASSAVHDGVTWLMFNGFPDPDYYYGRDWAAALTEALGAGPARVVVDERTGYGGAATGLNYLASFFLGDLDFYLMELYPQLDWPLDAGLVDDLRSCYASSYDFEACGMFEQWSVSDTSNGNQRAAAASRTALLLSMDVSGNDFFTKLMTYRAADTRIFGPTGTWGAFGPIIDLPAHIGELSGGSFQIQDTKFRASGLDPDPEFATGTGIAPDEVVLQKQSDALKGVDTLVEAAKAWVLQ